MKKITLQNDDPFCSKNALHKYMETRLEVEAENVRGIIHRMTKTYFLFPVIWLPLSARPQFSQPYCIGDILIQPILPPPGSFPCPVNRHLQLETSPTSPSSHDSVLSVVEPQMPLFSS